MKLGVRNLFRTTGREASPLHYHTERSNEVNEVITLVTRKQKLSFFTTSLRHRELCIFPFIQGLKPQHNVLSMDP